MWLAPAIGSSVYMMAGDPGEFGAEYAEPVEGIIIPAPDVIYKGKPVGKRAADSFNNDYLPALNLQLLISQDPMVFHISNGMGFAICNNHKFEEVNTITSVANMCMECQYRFWRDRQNRRNRY